jgi:hypothetical protein
MKSPPAPSPSVPSRVDLDPGSAGCDREDRRGGVVAAVPDRLDASSRPAGHGADLSTLRRGTRRPQAPAGAAVLDQKRPTELPPRVARRGGAPPRDPCPDRTARAAAETRRPSSSSLRPGGRPGRPASRLELGDPAPPIFLGTNYVRIYTELVAVDCSGRSPLDASIGR